MVIDPLKAPRFAFEDFPVGWRGSYGAYCVTEQEMKAFAQAYDPQPFHLDEQTAQTTLLKGLAASGWHSCALVMRLMYDAFLHKSTSMGSPGVEEVRWLKPVRPDDVLTLHYEVVDARRSRSKPDMGLVTFHFDLEAASASASHAPHRVMSLVCLIMFGVRS